MGLSTGGWLIGSGACRWAELLFKGSSILLMLHICPSGHHFSDKKLLRESQPQPTAAAMKQCVQSEDASMH